MKEVSISKACGLGAMAICVFVIVSWQFFGDSFFGVHTNIPQTTPLTAAILLIFSLSLIVAAENQTRKIDVLKILGLGLVSLSVLIVLWTGIQYLFHLKPGIEMLLYTKAVLKQSEQFPGRPSPRTVVTSLILGTTLFLAFINASHYHRAINILVFIGAVVPWVALFGYVSVAQQFYAMPQAPATGMSPITAFSFLLIGVGVIGLSPNTGLIGLLKTSTSGGDLSRKFLPLVIIIPLLLSLWFNHNITGQSMAVAKSWGLVSIFMIALILMGSSMIHKRDLAKNQLLIDLQNAEKKMRTILESAPDSMVIVNNTGAIVMVNSQTERLFGFSQSELINKKVEMLMPNKFRASHVGHRQEYDKNPTARSMGIGMELLGKHKDGHEFPIEISLSPIMMEEETLTCAAIRDVTDRKKKELEIRKLNKELEAFTYSVSHDLRAPLRSIHGYTEILEEDYSDKFDEEGKQVLNVVKRNATKMGVLIDDLLNFSRLGRQGLHKQNVDIKKMVDHILGELEQVQNLSDYQWTISKKLPVVSCDYTLLHQVFVNLLTNAIKYSAKSKAPLIEVGAYRDARYWVFFVKDNGVGFDMKYQGKLFKVFQRLHKMEEYEGTGVGLAIVKLIIEKHGGQVWAESAIDRGATFYLSLPAEDQNTSKP